MSLGVCPEWVRPGISLPSFAARYLAIISCHFWPELPVCLKHLPVPGPEAHSFFGRFLGGAFPPDGGIQAVDGDVLHHL